MKVKFEFEVDTAVDNPNEVHRVITGIAAAIASRPVAGIVSELKPVTANPIQGNVVDFQPKQETITLKVDAEEAAKTFREAADEVVTQIQTAADEGVKAVEEAKVTKPKKEKVVKDIDTSELMPSADVEMPEPDKVDPKLPPLVEVPADETAFRDALRNDLKATIASDPTKNQGLIAILHKYGAENISKIAPGHLALVRADFDAVLKS